MGCSLAPNVEPEMITITEPLSNATRFGAFLLSAQKPDYILVYDFQEDQARVIRLVLDPPLSDYSVHINYPLIFVAGGIERKTGKYSTKLWSTSAGNEVLEMTECLRLSLARARPFLVSPKEGAIYIIGGITKDRRLSRICEKLEIGGTAMKLLQSLSSGSDFVVGVGKMIFAFGVSGARNRIEVLDVGCEDYGWKEIVIADCPITHLDGFGILAGQESERQILIFGGRNKGSGLNTRVFSLDKGDKTITFAGSLLPKKEEFLIPTTAGKQVGFAISRNFEVYKYEKKTERWAICSSSIVKRVQEKNLTLV